MTKVAKWEKVAVKITVWIMGTLGVLLLAFICFTFYSSYHEAKERDLRNRARSWTESLKYIKKPEPTYQELRDEVEKLRRQLDEEEFQESKETYYRR